MSNRNERIANAITEWQERFEIAKGNGAPSCVLDYIREQIAKLTDQMTTAYSDGKVIYVVRGGRIVEIRDEENGKVVVK